MTETELRRLGRADLPALLDLYDQLFAPDLPEREPGARAAVWDSVVDDPQYVYLGAFVGSVLAAVAFLTVVPTVARGGRPFGVIENVVTHRDYRRRGLGKAVMDSLVERAFALGCFRVTLSTDFARGEAHEFYEALGFDGTAKMTYQRRAPGF